LSKRMHLAEGLAAALRSPPAGLCRVGGLLASTSSSWAWSDVRGSPRRTRRSAEQDHAGREDHAVNRDGEQVGTPTFADLFGYLAHVLVRDDRYCDDREDGDCPHDQGCGATPAEAKQHLERQQQRQWRPCGDGSAEQGGLGGCHVGGKGCAHSCQQSEPRQGPRRYVGPDQRSDRVPTSPGSSAPTAPRAPRDSPSTTTKDQRLGR
jgi:hypothetical protein